MDLKAERLSPPQNWMCRWWKFSLLSALICSGLHQAGAVTFQINDAAEFSQIIDTNAVLTTNATINSWLEGPVWIPSGGGYLIFCDQGNNLLKKLVPPGTVSNFLTPAPPANTLYNGTMLDAQEQLVACQAGSAGMRIVMVTNNVVTVLTSNCNSLKFYSPNDLVVKSDGTIWFSDPGYNSGHTQPPVPPGYQTGYYVYQFNPTNGNATCTPVITNFVAKPNGLCFSPDESKLYVCDNGVNGNLGTIDVFNVTSSNTVTGGKNFCTVSSGIADGIRCDVDGRIWSSAGDGLEIFAPDGHLIGKILMTRVTNLCFGGPQYETLYMVGQPYVTSLPVLVAGTPSIKKLGFSFDGSQMNLFWPSPSTGYELQSSGSLSDADEWSDVDAAPVVTNNQNVVNIEITNSAMFFRLRLN
jgi:gluconolactonase